MVFCAAALLPGAVLACGANAPRLERWPSGSDGLWWVHAPWSHPEAVFGAAGLPQARHWAHADVARAMRTQCARCVTRLRQRLGDAASDLGRADTAVRWPRRVLRGSSGRLGPLDWWRLQRAPGAPVTLWQVRRDGVLTAHGLLWVGDAPDLRDSRVDAMRAATQRLAVIARGATRLMGEQGEPAALDELDAHLTYWNALDAALRSAQSRGDNATTVPTTLPGVDGSRTTGSAHALNWQRTWRHAEDQALRP